MEVPLRSWRADRRGQAGSGYQEAGEQEENIVQPRVSFNGNWEQKVDGVLQGSGKRCRSGTGRFGNR